MSFIMLSVVEPKYALLCFLNIVLLLLRQRKHWIQIWFHKLFFSLKWKTDLILLNYCKQALSETTVCIQTVYCDQW